MNKDIINTVILGASFLLLFGLAEFLYHKLKVKAELTRKLVHFGTGMLTLLFPVMLDNQWLVLLLCGSFALILLYSLKFNQLKSINAIDRKSHGSILFPLAVYCCYLVYNYYKIKTGQRIEAYIYFYLPVLTLAICDPVAALFGKKFPYGKFKTGKDIKTFSGSGAFFISSLVLTILVFLYFGKYSTELPKLILISAVIALCGSTVEAISGSGTDNLTIPATVLATLILLL